VDTTITHSYPHSFIHSHYSRVNTVWSSVCDLNREPVKKYECILNAFVFRCFEDSEWVFIFYFLIPHILIFTSLLVYSWSCPSSFSGSEISCSTPLINPRHDAMFPSGSRSIDTSSSPLLLSVATTYVYSLILLDELVKNVNRSLILQFGLRSIDATSGALISFIARFTGSSASSGETVGLALGGVTTVGLVVGAGGLTSRVSMGGVGVGFATSASLDIGFGGVGGVGGVGGATLITGGR